MANNINKQKIIKKNKIKKIIINKMANDVMRYDAASFFSTS